MPTVTVPKTKAAKAKADSASRLKQMQRAAILLKQVSDPTRLQIILMLSEGEKHVGALCETLNQSQPATSHHLALLRHGGIIAPRRQGKNNFYSLTRTGRTARQDRQGRRLELRSPRMSVQGEPAACHPAFPIKGRPGVGRFKAAALLDL